MGKKQFDAKAVSALLEKGKEEVARTKPAEKKGADVPKKYLTLYLTEELCDRIYDYQNEYRKGVARQEGLHPGISGAIERLLRQHFKLEPL